MKKKGAIELSIGTIVIIVLAMSMLILGLVLIKNIFSGATSIADLNKQQISKQIQDVYGDNEELVILPNVDILKVTAGKGTAFAIRIQNLLENVDASTVKFAYELNLEDIRECGFAEQEVFSWMKGEEESGIEIPSAGEYIGKILVEIPKGTALCSFKIRVSVTQNNQPYANDQIFMEIKA